MLIWLPPVPNLRKEMMANMIRKMFSLNHHQGLEALNTPIIAGPR
jgi:hypothetical protein